MLFDDSERVSFEFLHFDDFGVGVKHGMVGFIVEGFPWFWLLLILFGLEYIFVELLLGGEFVFHLHDGVEV